MISIVDNGSTTTVPIPTGTLEIDGGPFSDTFLINTLTLNVNLTVDGGVGSDSIEVAGNLTLPGKNLTLNAESITVDSGVVISTTKTDGSGHATANSGTMVFNATAGLLSGSFTSTITLQSGSQLLANVNSGSTFSPGDITMTAISEFNIPCLYVHVQDTDGEVNLNSATINGGNFLVTATGDSTTQFGEGGSGISGDVASVANIGLGFLGSVSDVVGVAVSYATGKINVNSGTQITGRYDSRPLCQRPDQCPERHCRRHAAGRGLWAVRAHGGDFSGERHEHHRHGGCYDSFHEQQSAFGLGQAESWSGQSARPRRST